MRTMIAQLVVPTRKLMMILSGASSLDHTNTLTSVSLQHQGNIQLLLLLLQPLQLQLEI